MKSCLPALLSLLSIGAVCRGELVAIPALKDTTLYESANGSQANGAGDSLFAGRTNQQAGSVRRSVFEFDIQALVPANAQINSATLTLHAANSRPAASSFALHRLTREWTEGTTVATGNGGSGGSPVLGNDATWLHATSSEIFWTGPGAAGDFVGTASSTSLVGGSSGFYSWAGLLSDVQMWLSDAGSNHGWILIGDESQTTTAVRFESRTSGLTDNRPVLLVDFTVIPEPGSAVLFASGLLLAWRRRR